MNGKTLSKICGDVALYYYSHSADEHAEAQKG